MIIRVSILQKKSFNNVFFELVTRLDCMKEVLVEAL